MRRHYRYLFLSMFIAFCLLPPVSFADEIHSRSVVVMDALTGEMLYAKDPFVRRPPASTTKLMTAIITVENANLSDIVTISRNTSRVSPHKTGFREGDQITVEQLLYAALLDSANDAAVALSELISGSEARFVKLMNRKALAIGAMNTRFVNSSGLPGPGQYTTAYDLAKIMSYALQHHKLKEIMGTRVARISTEDGNSIFLRNTNKLLWSEETLVGGKTGYTRKAQHCFVCAAEHERETVIVAILGSSSRDGLWRESCILIHKGFEVLGNKGNPVPVNSLTGTGMSKVSRVTNMNITHQNSKSGEDKRIVSQKTAKPMTKIFAKKKIKTKRPVRNKTYAKGRHNGKKNFNVAEQSRISRVKS